MPNKTPDLPVLLVDDDEMVCEYYVATLAGAMLNNTITCLDSRDVLGLLRKQDVKLIVLDLMMPNISGNDLLIEIKEEFPNIPVIMVTAIDELETAVECMRRGAFDYMVKPVKKNRLISAIKRAIDMRELKDENINLRRRFFSDKLESPEAFSEIVTDNQAMRAIFRYIESICTTSRPVLITGETGVGKELVARAIHKLSGRKGELVSINLAGLDDNSFSDALFGHKRGAFTGADSKRGGLIEKAVGGTLFLDEIGDLKPVSQVKLLRLLQEGEYYPLGSDDKHFTDARIVVATNRDLEKMMDEGRFRRDLFYRLCDHHVEIPPLRERMDDLPRLLDHFISETATSLGKEKPAIPSQLLTLLSTYNFPGNIRELKSLVVDGVSVSTGGTLLMESFHHRVIDKKGGISKGLNASPAGPGKPAMLDLSFDPSTFSNGEFPLLKDMEDSFIKEAMKRANGKQSIAAKMLGLSRPTLNKRLKRLNLI